MSMNESCKHLYLGVFWLFSFYVCGLVMDETGWEKVAIGQQISQETYFPDLADSSPLVLHAIHTNRDRLLQYDLFEIDLDISATYDNPFDPCQIDIVAHFSSPAGASAVVPGFYYREYGGEPTPFNRASYFKVRFTPKEEGQYTFVVFISNDDHVIETQAQVFSVEASDRRGFIQVDPISQIYLQYENGGSYFAVGESLAWPHFGMDFMTFYGTMFQKLSENGCNYSRVWTCDWNIPLEWTAAGAGMGTCYDIGKYSLDNAWRLDQLLELAKRYGIHLLLTLDTYGSLASSSGNNPWGEDRWDSENPYNKIFGGPCDTPEDFFTLSEARDYYKRRLRYILARWGYSPHVLCFEFWNEVDAPRDWHKEMACFMKDNDPYGHLISSSFGYPWNNAYDEDNLWRIPEIDYIQYHLYSRSEAAEIVPSIIEQRREAYGKPCILAEYGLDASTGQGDAKYDTHGDGVQLHNAIWSSIASGAMGIPMTHWVNYVEYATEGGLYHEFQNASNFTSIIPWAGAVWQDVILSDFRDEKNSPLVYSDLSIPWNANWANESPNPAAIDGLGKVSGTINRFIHGNNEAPGFVKQQILTFSLPTEGALILNVNQVADTALIKVFLNDNPDPIWEKDFIPAGGAGEWESSRFDKTWNIWFATYNREYRIPLPAGDHAVRIVNEGRNWLQLNSYRLTNFFSSGNLSKIRALGRCRDSEGFIWFHHRDYNCRNIHRWPGANPNNPTNVEPLSFSCQVEVSKPGTYTIELWNTHTGAIDQVYYVDSMRRTIPLAIEGLKQDILVRYLLVDLQFGGGQ